VSHGADKTGPLAGVPYDGQDPAFADLYGVPWKDTGYGYEGPQDVGPPAFGQNFEDRMKDLIDRYHPDLYYTDGGPPFKDKGYKIVAHLYNQSMQLHGGKLQAVANFKGDCPIGAENFENEFPSTLQKNFWQTDKTMSPEWYWLRNQTTHYRKGFQIVHTLIDIVSKNGNFLLNVPLTGDGELEDATITMLKDMGHDFDLIGEAIFSTRTWEAFGEGHKNFNGISSGSAEDIRFTRNKANTVLYITTLGWPGDGAVVKVQTLGKCRIDLKSLKSASLLGTTDKLKFNQDDESLQITLPPKAPYACSAYAIKMVFAGQIPKLKGAAALLWQAQARDLEGAEDRAIYALPAEGGVLLLDVPAGSDAARAGLVKDDVIMTCNGAEVKTVAGLRDLGNKADGKKLALAIIRKQKPLTVELSDYAYSLRENVATLGFKALPCGAASAVLPAQVSSGGAKLSTGAVDLLVDGKVDRACGPTFADGVDTGKVRFDLGENKSIAQVNTYASGATRARQSFTLYGSSAASDPGWNVADTALFTPVITMDSRGNWTQYEATSIRRSEGKPLGSFRWLIWAATPTMGVIGGQNMTFEEMQVIPAGEPIVSDGAAKRAPAAVLPGNVADPHIAVFEDVYYLYPTSNPTSFHGWTSTDLKLWKDEGVILDLPRDLKWADRKAWAPAIAAKNNKYYFYYSANQNIGVAVSDHPTGPFRDPLGKPLVGKGEYRCQVIDPMVFVDEDGSAYLYFGQGKCMAVKLNDDMISFDSKSVKAIELAGYNEGPFVLKRNGIYYLSWSEFDTRDPRYSVSYATSKSPLGPYIKAENTPILRQSGEVKATGHHSIVKVPGCDKWAIAYHRFHVPGGSGFNRETCISPLRFDDKGAILPVDVFEPVPDDFIKTAKP
ncbi:MAG: family 43 glycosylhydrolase, partial [bacterium]